METKNLEGTRIESDLIGAREIPSSALYGVQTLRGIENFPISNFHLCDYPRFIYGLAVTKTQVLEKISPVPWKLTGSLSCS